MGTFLSVLSAVRAAWSLYKTGKEAVESFRREQAKNELKRASDKAASEGDQRDFEKTIGSTTAGLPTKHPLSSVRRRDRED